jgi:hypothetical protein
LGGGGVGCGVGGVVLRAKKLITAY